MTPDRAIINRLLEVTEGDERGMESYLTGLLQPFVQPFADLNDSYKKVHFAIPEKETREIIKAILQQAKQLQRIDSQDKDQLPGFVEGLD